MWNDLIKELESCIRHGLRDDHIIELVQLLKKIAPTEASALLTALSTRLNHEFCGVDLFSTVLPGRYNEEVERRRVQLFTELCDKNLRLLELGCWSAWPDQKVTEFLLKPPHINGGFSEFIRLDYDDTYSPDLVASCDAIPLQSGTVDFVRSNSLLEHVRDPLSTISECYRILSPGGIMEHTLPLHFLIHQYPKDYTRMSPDYFLDNCNDIGFEDVFVSVAAASGRFYTSLNFINSFDINITKESVALVELAKLLLLLLSELDISDRGRDTVAHSIYVNARKPGKLIARNAKRDENGILFIPEHTTTVSRLSQEFISPKTRRGLQYTGSSLVDNTEEYRIRNGKTAYLRDIDAIARTQVQTSYYLQSRP